MEETTEVQEAPTQEAQEAPEQQIENDYQQPEHTDTQSIVNGTDAESDYNIPTDTNDYNFDDMSDAELEAVIAELEASDEQELETPEFTLPDKFNNVDDLIKSYQMLEGKMGNFVKAPDAYVVDGVDMSDPIMSELSNTAKELNMSNDAFSAIVTKYNEVQDQMEDIQIQQEMTALGQGAEQRIANINNYIDNNMNPHQGEVLRSMATSAESVAAIEALIQQARPSSPTTNAPQPASNNPTDMMWAKDQ